MKTKTREIKLAISILVLLCSLSLMLLSANNAHANAFGYVHCDVNNDGIMTIDDVLLAGVTVNVNGISTSYFQSATTDAGGYFSIPLLDSPQTYSETLDPASIPNNAVIVVPAGGQIILNVTNPANDIGPGLWMLSYASCKPIICGDNWLDANEECDDGNTVPGDGCRADCTIERCGDNILDPQEGCDDGNTSSGDGCRADCTIESCGDGILDAGEQCDDGNTTSGDGCRANCTIESCGDNILDPQEQCDDGNTTSGDGCSETCTVEQMGQGCTPGYWKQSQHFDSWPVPYMPDTLFSTVFEDAFPGKTLLQVLETGGGGLNALGRHTVAALLNAASSVVNYDLTSTEVITLFNNVYPGTNEAYTGVKDGLADYNEMGCPLN